MKICFSKLSRRRSGSAIIVVLVLLFLMTLIVTSNSLALHRLKQTIQSIEQKQLRHASKPG
ncbi:MAG: hypothetical protein ABSG59_00755 [Verrucomicrobiota bacterium]|jgi:type II secretory pathway component PulK